VSREVPARERAIRRVLMTADTVGGVWTYAMELAGALAARGVEVVLATMGDPISPAQWRDAARVPRLELRESRYRLEWMQEPWADVEAAGEWLLDIAAEVQPDVVHLNGYAHATLPWRVPVAVVAHSCVLSWWEAVHHRQPPAEWDRYRTRVRRGLQAADVVVSPSRAYAVELGRLYGTVDALRVIANGRRAELFPPLVKAQLVFAAGRLWDEAKNVQALVRAATRVRWPVLVAGAGEPPDGGGVDTGKLCFLGKLSTSEIASWMGRATIYALPARYEPFGLSVLEAALARCALVLGDIPTLRETWDGAAEFVAPDDGDALAAAIESLTRDPGRCARLAERARTRALALTPAAMAERYLAVYRELAESGRCGCNAGLRITAGGSSAADATFRHGS